MTAFFQGLWRVLSVTAPWWGCFLVSFALAYVLTPVCRELARRLGEAGEVLMIVPQDYAESEGADNVLTLRNPISQDALVQALRALAHCQSRMEKLRLKADKLERTLEDRKIVDRAKGRLMDTLHLSEAEAHYRIQKQSMDSGRRIADVAREILESAEIAAS